MCIKYDDLVGVPFLEHGRDPRKGLDCWGLVRTVYSRVGIELPDRPEYMAVDVMDSGAVSGLMKIQEPRWKKIVCPQVPCVVALSISCGSWANHVGVYVGEGKFVHAYRLSGVVVDRISHWRSRIIGFYKPGWLDDPGNNSKKSV